MKHKHNSEILKSEKQLSDLLFNKTENFVAKLNKNVQKQDTHIVKQEPVWKDEDDYAYKIKGTKTKNAGILKRKYETLMGTPNWAKLDKKLKHDDSDDEQDEILRTVGHLQKVKSHNLKKGFIELKRFPKITISSNAKNSIIRCLEFHPTSSVMLVGTTTGFMTLFSIGGDINNNIHSFKLRSFNRTLASCFTPDGNEAYIASEMSKYYCVYNLIKAEPKLIQYPSNIKKPKVFVLSNDGQYLAVGEGFDEIHIVATNSKELIRSLKHNKDVVSVAFSSDGKNLFSYCAEGEIYVWNMVSFRVSNKFYDQGCITPSCITTSPCGRLLATGSGEGIVNIYEIDKIDSASSLPVKTLQNLRTRIKCLKFNPSSEILAMSSDILANSVKLAHIPSYHVFSNFPDPNWNLNQIESVSFSPNSGYMSISNNKGIAYLYRLKHYKNY